MPLFQLLEPAHGAAMCRGDLVWEGPHEAAAGAYQRRYEIPEGHVILTTWQGRLHEVVCRALPRCLRRARCSMPPRFSAFSAPLRDAALPSACRGVKK